ncbi:hypothetical protein [Rhodococcus sp. IEGM 1318]|uniref:hypothetical protein n=1 Tax=Rhodococcus sp. IEGM 1318 TaxID=3082226 RepID=UPI002955DCA6|nr:hypothetical protein [Rhodococcus sp. IEGM 1318]MDV8004835.1 hypothetical protein [Rhodococcus sp. IEGM 1318]
MKAARRVAVVSTSLVALSLVTVPIASANETTPQKVEYVASAPLSSPKLTGFERALGEASNPNLQGDAAIEPRAVPAAALAAPAVRVGVPAAAKVWGKRAAVAGGAAAVASAGAELGKDAYNGAKNVGKKVIGIWN